MASSSMNQRNVRIDAKTTSEEIFAFFDAIDSDDENDIHDVLNDSETEFVLEESDHVVEETLVQQSEAGEDVLVPEASIKVTRKSSEPLKKKMKRKLAELKWKRTRTHRQKQECTLLPEVLFENTGEFAPYEVFRKSANFKELVKLLVTQSNLYAMQKCRQFLTNEEEMSAFLGINYTMSINKLPTIKSYWQIDSFFGNEGIQSVMTRDRFMDILRNLHFADNDTSDESDKGMYYLTILSLHIYYILKYLKK